MPTSEKIWIVGPCSAESREQVSRIAAALSGIIPSQGGAEWVFRAGVWKPRTSPESFQGAGDEALGWLQAVTETTGLPTATEVATPEHVEAALAAGIDYLWIGARTAANPIAVQAIADAILTKTKTKTTPGGLTTTKTETETKTTVLVKNPVNEDVNLWLGNIERLEQALVSCDGDKRGQVMAIHRGCNHRPCWAMAFELRRRRPDIPLLLDPSHMSGDATKVAGLCQQAMDLNYDGLMIEVHDRPAEALSDGKQQITPDQLRNILTTLTIRDKEDNDTELLALRHQIDELDDELWSIIERRMQVSEQIGKYKASHQVPVLQTNRYDAILQRRLQWADVHHLSRETVQAIMDAIHRESVSRQL